MKRTAAKAVSLLLVLCLSVFCFAACSQTIVVRFVDKDGNDLVYSAHRDMWSACGNGTGAGSREIVPLSNGIHLTVNSFTKHIPIRFRYKNTDIDPMEKREKQGA